MLDHTHASSLCYNELNQIYAFDPGYVSVTLAHPFIYVKSNER